MTLTVFFIYTVRAQVFPVNVTPQVIPPYSLQLSEYTTSASEKLLVNLLLTDITRSNLEIRLKLYIENNAGLSIQSTDVVIDANPIFLDGGVSLRLSNIDLQPYFAFQNLTGITPQKYGASLPEGMYRFCFEAYEVISGKQISRKSCAMAYLVLNDPPFLNLPNNGEQVAMRDPQNIIFQWTPRHLNATNVEYEFTLTELWDSKMDPQALFLASQPLYQTTTSATTLLYGPSETTLLPNKKYGWRVRAVVSDGISESSVFKNKGYSEIHSFTYSGDCAEPSFVLAGSQSPTSQTIYWKSVNHLKYNVQYRKKGVENAVWFEIEALDGPITVYNLEPGTSYEFRVGGQCIENGPYTYSQIYEFTTIIASTNDKVTVINCGITPEIVITNQESLKDLKKGDVFTAGDFEVVVENVSTSGQMFSGKGYIKIPYLKGLKVKVTFDNIEINTDKQLLAGVVETIYDKNSEGVVDVDDIDDVIDSVVDTVVDIIREEENENVEETTGDDSVKPDENENEVVDVSPVSENPDVTIPNENEDEVEPPVLPDNPVATPVTEPNPVGNNNTDTEGNRDNNAIDEDVNTKIWFESDGTLYRDGETIDIKYNSKGLPVVFQLKDYPKETKEFKWQIFKEDEDQTVNFIIGQDINTDQDTFSLDLKRRSGPMRLRITYDDKKIEVNLNIIKKSFDFVELTATHNDKRTAKSGETLYVVNDWSILKGLGNKEIIYKVDLDPDPKSNEYYNDITWSFDEQDVLNDKKRITRKLKYTDSTIVVNNQRKVIPKSVITKISAGYPDKTEKSVEVQWVNAGRIRRDVTSKAKPILESFDKFNEVSKAIKKIGFGCGLTFFNNYKDLIRKKDFRLIYESYKEENKESRFYNKVKQFKFMASGVDVATLECGGKIKIPIPFIPNPEFELKLKIETGLRGTADIKYEEEVETEYKTFANSNVSGGGYINPSIQFGAKDISLFEKDVLLKLDVNAGIVLKYPYKGDSNFLGLEAYVTDIYAYIALDDPTTGASFRHNIFELDIQSDLELYKFNIKEFFEEEREE
ncbi:fibronectin type III domain-containing protein [Aquimarina megaterium]|uniref:fibronectin type III domain-containing protein n=1 Tax=Aquimarina megaterium TaxID=1443666 RepID=UPI000554C0AC|nr:fibronectin type III domain-containing protein [Aquimarina megaterium]